MNNDHIIRVNLTENSIIKSTLTPPMEKLQARNDIDGINIKVPLTFIKALEAKIEATKPVLNAWRAWKKSGKCPCFEQEEHDMWAALEEWEATL